MVVKQTILQIHENMLRYAKPFLSYSNASFVPENKQQQEETELKLQNSQPLRSSGGKVTHNAIVLVHLRCNIKCFFS